MFAAALFIYLADRYDALTASLILAGCFVALAAIFGVLLMMCVLGTINLGRAVYEKVQLQSAADAAAYSQAAVEARVMNYTAYTNRAMVVHYASIMAATVRSASPLANQASPRATRYGDQFG